MSTIEAKYVEPNMTRQEDRDSLTGVYHREAAEEQITQALRKRQSGGMLLINVDGFRTINNRYGHITGDWLLQNVAKLLEYMTLRDDIVGRISGDEFVVFSPHFTEQSNMDDRCWMIERRFREFQQSNGNGIPLSVTIGSSLCEENDTYVTLLTRTAEQLISRKRSRKQKSREGKSLERGLESDIRRIREELREEELRSGAYCQDYDTFKSIYRFMERMMRRSSRQACIVLITLTDGHGQFPALSVREGQMTLLGNVIQSSLRAGDVFTRYTSCQYLVLAVDVTSELAERIAQRVCIAFEELTTGLGEGRLVHYCYPLHPASDSK